MHRIVDRGSWILISMCSWEVAIIANDVQTFTRSTAAHGAVSRDELFGGEAGNSEETDGEDVEDYPMGSSQRELYDTLVGTIEPCGRD